ncbi:MAG: glycine cleavage system protein GcvH [Brevibacterium yomogidense]|uniref:Glycine cleavage system H protein n=1 Tax=Brevibacterium yomogidense TaxID=946573 RepID=A0A1X6WU41_9MICO|nr:MULTISPECIES: glycine cleavage system protein GcvH [Brevibacterium]SLM88652.1 Glycine cleavage system H protein [Brevibacterium yomogidense]SMX99025.1 glycine cleavage system H protein [Brevibacterium sp. Mu109]
MAELPALPKDYSYSAEHEWVNATAESVAGTTVKVGITAVASDALGEVVFVEAPEVGDTVTAGETCGEVESTKSVSDLYSPVTGEVTAVNELVSANPGILNSDPYGEGWLFEVAVTEAGPLMDHAAYAEANHLS